MFLLFLIVLGTAGVKAQVRIGGNTAPSAAAVLDLNASDAANLATGGLVLPRVDLKTNVMQLTPGVANQTGTMVYNVTTTLGRIGVYYWNGNTWVLASLPSTSLADSGKLLMNIGGNIVLSNLPMYYLTNTATQSAPTATTLTAYTITATLPAMAPNTIYRLPLSSGAGYDVCWNTQGGAISDTYIYASYVYIRFYTAAPSGLYSWTCLRHS